MEGSVEENDDFEQKTEKNEETKTKRPASASGVSGRAKDYFYEDECSSTLKCRTCKLTVKAPSGNTTNLIAHLRNHHQKDYQEFEKIRLEEKKAKLTGPNSNETTGSKQATLQQFTQLSKPFTADHPKQVAMTKKIVKMICHDVQPLGIVDDEGFRDLLKVAEPRYVIPSRKSLTYDIIPKMYQERRSKIVEELSSKNVVSLALTTDGWTSCTNQSYVSFTAHYVDEEFVLKEHCLRVQQFDESHTAFNLSNAIKKAVKLWTNPDEMFQELCNPSNDMSKQINDPPCKIPIYVVTDNAANITSAVQKFTGFQHVPCFAHTIQLCVNGVLRKFPQFDMVYDKAKTITTHFRHSSLDTKKLTTMEKQLGIAELKLKQECITRWNSMYHMLERLLAVKEPLSAVLISQTKVANLLPAEWKTVENIVSVLAPFERVTTIMSGAKYPTISMLIPVINELKQSIWRLVIDGAPQEIVEFCHALVESIDQRWPNYERVQLYAAATLLDPRYKDCGFMDADAATAAQGHVFGVAKKLMNGLRAAADDMPTAFVTPSASSTSLQENTSGESATESWEWLRKRASQKSNQARSIPMEVGLKRELDAFLSVPNIPINLAQESLTAKSGEASCSKAVAKSSRDNKASLPTPLQWWAKHKHVYPGLSVVARMLLGVPATSVSSERLFSKAGSIISDRRSKLTPQHAEELCFLSNNWSDV